MSHFSDRSDVKHIGFESSRGHPAADGLQSGVDRKSPPTDRVVLILNMLADSPRQRFTLTEIAGPLGLNKPTCLGILTALVEADFITRDIAKTYGLGPSLLRLGVAAETGFAAIDVVRPHIVRLHEKVRVGCLLSAVQGDAIVIVDRLGDALPNDHRDLVGQRFPLVPPLGLVNLAWSDDRKIQKWLGIPPLVPLLDDPKPIQDLLDKARREGCVVERLDDSQTTPNVVIAGLVGSGLPDRIVNEMLRHLPPADWSEFVGATESATSTSIANISAPIFDRRHHQKYTLTLMPNQVNVSPEQRSNWISELLTTTEAATAALAAASAGSPHN